MMIDSYNVEKELRRIINTLFRWIPSIQTYWTEEKGRLANSLKSVPIIDSHFVEDAKLIFIDIFPNMIFEDYISYGRGGLANALVGYEPKEELSFYLLVCVYYPIATLRPNLGFSGHHFSCLESDGWNSPVDEKIVNCIFEREIKLLTANFSALLEAYGYIFLPYDSKLFRKRILVDLFHFPRIWDYLFFIGDGIYMEPGWKSGILPYLYRWP